MCTCCHACRFPPLAALRGDGLRGPDGQGVGVSIMGPGLQSPHQATVLHQVSISWPVEPLLNTVIMCNYLVITDTHMKLSCMQIGRELSGRKSGSSVRGSDTFLWSNRWFYGNQWTKYSFMWGYDVMTRWWWLVLCIRQILLDLTLGLNTACL